jgi:NADH pyrophosphatase NudC (nudix superfamily)
MRHDRYTITCTAHGQTRLNHRDKKVPIVARFKRSVRWLRKAPACPACGKPLFTRKGFMTKGHDRTQYRSSLGHQKFYAPSQVMA